MGAPSPIKGQDIKRNQICYSFVTCVGLRGLLCSRWVGNEGLDSRVICKIKWMKPWVNSQCTSLGKSAQSHPSFFDA